jgi:sigma-B regulation protein RsbU (phosphoserine phosphatase)
MWVIAGALLVAAFLTDYWTGEEVSSSLYYVVAVSYTAWFLGRGPGLAMALLGSCSWFTAYVLVGHPFSSTAILVWNLIAESTIYTAAAWTLGSLRSSFRNAHALATRLRITNLALDRETQAVGRLQREMLPGQPPDLPGYEWSLHYETSTRAGGDYYDFVALPEGRVGILIADASGHGAAAAVLMAVTRALFHQAAGEALPPDRLLADLSRSLGQLLPPGWFVTAGYAILDPASGSLHYSLAGHDPPLLLRSGARRVERLPVRGGPLLGPFAQLPFASSCIELAPGDRLIMHTDGLTEAEDPEGHLLGEQAVQETLAFAIDLEPDAIRARLLERVARHRAGRPAGDDLTLLILSRRNGVAQ